MEKKKEEIKLEIEFYKDLSTKAFTADILVAGGTVTLLQSKGLTFWSVVGIFMAYFLSISFFIFLRLWRQKIKEFKELKDDS